MNPTRISLQGEFRVDVWFFFLQYGVCVCVLWWRGKLVLRTLYQKMISPGKVDSRIMDQFHPPKGRRSCLSWEVFQTSRKMTQWDQVSPLTITIPYTGIACDWLRCNNNESCIPVDSKIVSKLSPYQHPWQKGSGLRFINYIRTPFTERNHPCTTHSSWCPFWSGWWGNMDDDLPGKSVTYHGIYHLLHPCWLVGDGLVS